MNLQKVWQGSHRGINFKIVGWSFNSPMRPFPSGNWNYYIYLPESKCIDFAKLWLWKRLDLLDLAHFNPNMQNKDIEFYVKNVYGNPLAYVKDRELALAIKALTKQETLSANHMEGLKRLGFRFVQVLP